MQIDANDGRTLRSFQMLEVSEEEKKEFVQPDSIESVSSTQDTLDLSTFNSELISKKAKYALGSLAIVLAILFLVDLVLSIYELWQIHWLIGGSLLVGVTALSFFTLSAVREWLTGKNGVELVYELQEKARVIRERDKASFETAELFEALRAYYTGTPHESAFEEVVDGFPDYLNDKRRIEQFEAHFLEPLDRRVEAIIRRHSYQTGLSVAASPLPFLDVLLTVWRSAIMINEIAKTYGVKPTLANRVRVLVKVGRTAALAGLSQGAIDKLIDLNQIPFAGRALASTLQGLGAGVATARIGIYCASTTRPICSEDDKCFGSKLTDSIGILLGKKIIKAKEDDGLSA